MYKFIKIPAHGSRITRRSDRSLDVPNYPIIPFIEGDGTGRDIVPVMRDVVDAAVATAYGSTRKLAWAEVFAGEKARDLYGSDESLPDETISAIKEHLVAIKGPLSAGVGGGARSVSAALRLKLDCYAQVRPVRYFPGAPSPLKLPDRVNMVVFRETSEDIYVGIEWGAGSQQAKRLIEVLTDEFGVTDIRFPKDCSIGIKPISREGSQRLMRRAIEYAIRFGRRSVTMVHKGTVLKVTEGWFAKWGYEVARNEFGAIPRDDGATLKITTEHGDVVIKDTIADAFMQQCLIRPEDFDIIATTCQNGDYISSALAAQVGGVGIAPGANFGDQVAVFEPNHGSGPGYAGRDMVNPSAEILSAQMMLAHLGWHEAATILDGALQATIADRCVTYDFARLLDKVKPMSTSAFGQAVIARM
jgi:isocitrate dehydrogenase